MRDASRWLSNTQKTDPAEFRPQIEPLLADLSFVSGSGQKLAIHTDCLVLYGLDAGSFTGSSRATLPVQDRLGGLADSAPLDLAEGKPAAGRAVGTCRDFALLAYGSGLSVNSMKENQSGQQD